MSGYRRGLSLVRLDDQEPDDRGFELEPDELSDRWSQASLRDGWTRAADWWVPEVDAVVEALAEHQDVDDCVVERFSRLGRARAEAGVGLHEALDDLCALYDCLPVGEPPLPVVRSLVEAWAELALDVSQSSTCEDPLSGLASPAYLRTRLSEVYREAGRDGTSVADHYALLVLDLGTPQPADANARWDWLLQRLELGDCLRAVFSGGETLAGIGVHSVVGLVRRDEYLAGQVEILRARLAESDELSGVRIWIDGLPETLPSALDALSSVDR